MKLERKKNINLKLKKSSQFVLGGPECKMPWHFHCSLLK
jgi:hypothetical protein